MKKVFVLAMALFCLIACAAAYRALLIPAQIAPGGFTGAAQLVNYLTGWPVGTVSMCLNIPLFIISARSLGLRFGIRSLLATVLLSVLIDYLPIPAILDMTLGENLFLSAIFGGVLGGVGFGLILRGNATTGGSDMLGKLITRRFNFVSVGAVIFAVDALVIAASAFMFGAASAMLALISDYLMSRMIDLVVDGLNSARAYFIISEETDKIAEFVMNRLERGATRLNGTGMYSGEPRNVLLCVVSRTEAIQLRSTVARIDPNAFVIAAQVHEVLGEGFAPHIYPRAKRN